MQALYPLNYRGKEVAVGGTFEVETPEDRIEAERLAQRGVLAGVIEAAEAVPPVEGEPAKEPEPRPSVTAPLSTHDAPPSMTNAGRRRG